MKKKVKILKNKGILFWITGLSGSGKTSISKKIFPSIKKRFGPTILISGDELRSIFYLNKYDRLSRVKNALSYSHLAKHITDQGINIIINVIGMSETVRKLNRKKISNYIEIYIEADLNEIIKKGKKKIYKNKKNLIGKDIKAEFPKKPDIKIKNKFNNSVNQLSIELIKEISKVIR